MVSIYSGTHFLVDFACAFLMLRSIAGTSAAFICFLLYNFCAFAVQMPLGIIADRCNRNYLFAIIGCILVGLAFGLTLIPVVAVIIAGIGNAMFHLGGGIDVLNISEKKLGALGIFVSPGAFGVYFGTVSGRGHSFLAVPVVLSLVAAAGLIFLLHKAQKGIYPDNAEISLEGIGSRPVIIVTGCMFLVVCIRSYLGLTLSFPWKSSGYWSTALICAVVFGKVLGGILADRIGVIKTALLSLSTAVLLFLFPQIPVIGVIAVLMFNMTMPITLWTVVKMLPGAKGFVVGLLTFGIFLGYLPVQLGIDGVWVTSWMMVLLTAISLPLLILGLRRAQL